MIDFGEDFDSGAKYVCNICERTFDEDVKCFAVMLSKEMREKAIYKKYQKQSSCSLSIKEFDCVW